jgi:hypothetical protein
VVLQEPPVEFKRGDVDAKGSLEVADPINILSELFLGTFRTPCQDAADVDDNGRIELADAISSLTYLFLGTFAVP